MLAKDLGVEAYRRHGKAKKLGIQERVSVHAILANTGVWHGKQMGSKMQACLGFFALRQACLQTYRAETHKSRLSYFKALGVKPLSLYYIRFSGKRLGGIRNSVSVLLQKRIGRPPVSVSLTSHIPRSRHQAGNTRAD